LLLHVAFAASLVPQSGVWLSLWYQHPGARARQVCAKQAYSGSGDPFCHKSSAQTMHKTLQTACQGCELLHSMRVTCQRLLQ